MIIALRGRGNIGKTTTIGILYELLLTNNYEPLPGYFHGRVEISDILSKNGALMGITSLGDTYGHVSRNLWDFSITNCDLLICACRSAGGSCDAILEYTDQEIRFINKTIEGKASLRDRVNQSDALRLFTLIESLI